MCATERESVREKERDRDRVKGFVSEVESKLFRVRLAHRKRKAVWKRSLDVENVYSV